MCRTRASLGIATCAGGHTIPGEYDSLALLDHFFFFIFGLAKKGSGEQPIQVLF